MKRQAAVAATLIIVMLAVATIFVDVVAAQQPVPSSTKSSAPAKQDPPIFRPPIFNIHIRLSQ